MPNRLPFRILSFISFVFIALSGTSCEKDCMESEAAFIELNIHSGSGLYNPYNKVSGLGQGAAIYPVDSSSGTYAYKLHTSFHHKQVKYLFYRNNATDTLTIYYKCSEPYFKNDVCGYAVTTTLDSVRGTGFASAIVKSAEGKYILWL